MKKAIIYLGCSYPQLLNIQKIHATGVKIIGTDKNNIDPDIKNYLTEFYKISATDIESLKKLIIKLKKKYKFLFAYGVADYCYKAIGEIHKIINDSQLTKNYSNFISKIKSSQILKSSSVPHAELICHGENIKNFLKQYRISNFSGSSVLKIDERNNSSGVFFLKKTNEEKLVTAIKNSKYKGEKILLEKLIENYERVINLDGIIINKKFFPKIFTSRIIDKKNKTRNLAFIQPAIDLTEQKKSILIGYAEKIVKNLKLKFGQITLDIIENKNGEFYIIEISPHFHLIQSTIISQGTTPILELLSHKLRKKLVKTEPKKIQKKYLVCYEIYSRKNINYSIKKKIIKNLLKFRSVVDAYPKRSNKFNEGFVCIGLLWNKVSKKSEIEFFLKKINKIKVLYN